MRRLTPELAAVVLEVEEVCLNQDLSPKSDAWHALVWEAGRVNPTAKKQRSFLPWDAYRRAAEAEAARDAAPPCEYRDCRTASLFTLWVQGTEGAESVSTCHAHVEALIQMLRRLKGTPPSPKRFRADWN